MIEIKRKKIVIAAVVMVFCSNVCFGMNTSDQDEIGFVFANDVFFQSDQGYTNGMALSFSPALSPYTFRLGQDIYTPSDKTTLIPSSGEHPYGAWLYIAADYDFDPYYYFENRISLDIGTVGERALGEEVQNFFHSINNSKKGEGWDSQLNDEWGMFLTFRSEFKHPALNWQIAESIQFAVFPFLKVRAGSIFYDYSGGAIAQLSCNCLDSALISSFYLRASYEGKKVYTNIFLEGNGNPYSVDIEDTVDELRAEVGVTLSNYSVSFTYVTVSEEYVTQEKPSKYGILKCSRRF